MEELRKKTSKDV